MAITSAQALRLHKAVSAAGMDTSELRPENPWTMTGGKSAKIRAIVEASDPSLAQELVAETEPSLAFLALQEQAKTEDINLSDLPEALQREVMLRDGDSIRQQQQAAEEALLQKMEQQYRELAERNGRDPDAQQRPNGRFSQWQIEQQRFEQIQAATKEQLAKEAEALQGNDPRAAS